MAGNWIKLHRGLLNNPIVCKDSDHLAVWIYLLLEATHTSIYKLFNGKKIMLEPGQVITGRKVISDKLSISESKTQRILIAFESDHQIERQRGAKSSLISIVNWDKYQYGEQQNEQQLNGNRTASERQVNTLQERKKEKNERIKEIYKDLPLELIEPFEDYLKMRKTIKAPMTDRAINMIIKKLNDLSDGNTKKSAEIINQATIKCWKSFYPLQEEVKISKPAAQKEMPVVISENAIPCPDDVKEKMSKFLGG